MTIIDDPKRMWLIVFGMTIAMLVSIGGCSSLTKKNNQATAPSEKSDSEVTALYYDFGDVLVPKELKIDKKSSFIYQTEGWRTGFKGPY